MPAPASHRPDAGHLEPDFIEVCNEDNRRLALAQGDPEVPGAVRLWPGSARQRALNRRAHRCLHPGDAIGLDQRSEHPLHFGDAAWLLPIQDRRAREQEQGHPGSHWSPPIHLISASRNDSASPSHTVSTGVPAYETGSDHRFTLPNPRHRADASESRIC